MLVARLHAGICHHSPRKGYIGFPEFRQLRTEHLLGASADSAPRRSRTGNYIKLGNIPHLFWHSPVLPGNFPAGKNQPHTESDRDVRGSAQLYSRLQFTLPHVNRRTHTHTLPQLPSPLGLGALCSQSCPCPSACCLAWLCAFLAANWHPLVPAHSPNRHGTHVCATDTWQAPRCEFSVQSWCVCGHCVPLGRPRACVLHTVQCTDTWYTCCHCDTQRWTLLHSFLSAHPRTEKLVLLAQPNSQRIPA